MRVATGGVGVLDAAAATCVPCDCYPSYTCVPPTVRFCSDQNCLQTVASYTLDAGPSERGGCTTIPATSNAYVALGHALLTQSGCVATGGDAAAPPAVFAGEATACGPASGAAACPQDTPVPLPAAAPDAGPRAYCFYRDGNVGCPDAGFTSNTVLWQGVDDTRGCSACDCTMLPPTNGHPLGCNTGTYTVFTSSQCTSGTQIAGGPFYVDDPVVCQNITGNTALSISYYIDVSTPNADCRPTDGGGLPMGAATPGSPLTVCCKAFP
jgi:hypothetical protein